MGLLVAAILVCGTGVAVAGVSSGNYDPARHGCSGGADDSDNPSNVEPGCQNMTFNVRDGDGTEQFRTGTYQTADGDSVNNGDVTPGAAGDPSTGEHAYFGADDNLDNGEHDSSSKMEDGPSDGGAIVLNVTPQSVSTWLAELQSGNLKFLLTHPVPIVDAGAGSCADGLCESVQTQQHTAFQGGAKGQRDAANYDGKQWDPGTCAGPNDEKADCGGHDINYWRRKEGRVVVEPGAQVYEDPNPEGSPEGPYPIPSAYVGTCGVVLGGGTAPPAPASPVTNGAGQAVVDTCK